MDSLVGSKVGALFALLVAALIFGCLPFACLIHPTDRTKEFVSLCNSFAGGVFLATFLLHMLPEATENMDAALEAFYIHTNFPFSHFMVAVGFFLILIAELLAHRFYHPSKNHTHSHIQEDNRDCETDRLLQGENNHNGTVKDVGGEICISGNSVDASSEQTLSEPQKSILSSLMFLLALSLHSLFEGMAIGLQVSLCGILQVVLGVAIHKCIIIFSFSLSLVHSRVNRRSLVFYVLFLAMMSPLGVALGISVPLGTSTSTMVNGVLQSLAAGTFLFIIFFEILPGELQTHDVTNDTLLKTISMVVGFGLMTGLQFMDHDLDH